MGTRARLYVVGLSFRMTSIAQDEKSRFRRAVSTLEEHLDVGVYAELSRHVRRESRSYYELTGTLTSEIRRFNRVKVGTGRHATEEGSIFVYRRLQCTIVFYQEGLR